MKIVTLLSQLVASTVYGRKFSNGANFSKFCMKPPNSNFRMFEILTTNLSEIAHKFDRKNLLMQIHVAWMHAPGQNEHRNTL